MKLREERWSSVTTWSNQRVDNFFDVVGYHTLVAADRTWRRLRPVIIFVGLASRPASGRHGSGRSPHVLELALHYAVATFVWSRGDGGSALERRAQVTIMLGALVGVVGLAWLTR